MRYTDFSGCRISDVIERLNRIKEKEGDLPVMINDKGMGDWTTVRDQRTRDFEFRSLLQKEGTGEKHKVVQLLP